MRTFLTAFLACGLTAGFLAADEPKKADEKDKVVHEVDLKNVMVKIDEEGSGGTSKPLKITSVEELAKVVPDPESQEAIRKKVDFTKQYVLLFAWSGSGQDKIAPVLAKNEKTLSVTFAYLPGRTRDLRHHRKMFAINKEVEFKSPERKK